MQPKEVSSTKVGISQEVGLSDYDFDSVMHYRPSAFSTNGQATIIAHDPNFQSRMGQRRGFSDRDVFGVNALYGFPALPDPPPLISGPSEPSSECLDTYCAALATDGNVDRYLEVLPALRAYCSCPFEGLLEWELLNSTGFEAGWGIYIDGGEDARRHIDDAPFCNSGSYCVRIRDGSESSFVETASYDLSDYDDIEIEYSMIADSMEDGEGYWVEAWDGSTWVTLRNYIAGVDFHNGVRQTISISVSSDDLASMTEAKLRFRNDGSGNGDSTYFDDIKIYVWR